MIIFCLFEWLHEFSCSFFRSVKLFFKLDHFCLGLFQLSFQLLSWFISVIKLFSKFINLELKLPIQILHFFLTNSCVFKTISLFLILSLQCINFLFKFTFFFIKFLIILVFLFYLLLQSFDSCLPSFFLSLIIIFS